MGYMVYPYSSNSEGAKNIADGLGGMRIKREGSTYKFKEGDVIINWGSSDNPYGQALNAKIGPLLSKKEFFARLKGTGLAPQFALSKEGAELISSLTGGRVVCRELDKGKDGEGIKIWDGSGQVPEAKLYTQLIDKTAEYRVHVGRTKEGEAVIIGQQKKLWKGEAGGQVWAGENASFVWTVNGAPVTPPTAVLEVALATLKHFPEITFSGLDIVYNEATKKAYVLEGNSAPTMTPKTVEVYKAFFEKYYPVQVLPKVVTLKVPGMAPDVLEAVIKSVAAALPAGTEWSIAA